MCGICGFLAHAAVDHLDGAALDRMTDSMIQRGPDDRGVLLERAGDLRIGLGHRRLSIIDTSTAGRQPLSNEDGSVQVVFNGEIYNFQALRSELEARGHRFASRSDTEVLVHLWEDEGPALLDRLNGMFAFALWDRRQRKLLLARDQMGIKPLYYAFAGRALLFGSQLAPLLRSGHLSPEVDVQALHDYLGLNYVPGPRTILQGVRKLPSGHYLLVDGVADPPVPRRYWELRLASEEGAPRFAGGEEDAEAALADTLRRAVRRQMVSDVPLGMFLSGGVDSSSVLALMAEASPRPVQAFTIDFAQKGYSEVARARETARQYGADHHVMRVDPDPDGLLAGMIDSADEPFADSSALPTLALCRMAREHVTVALAGDGGDEIFAGYQTHRAHRYAALYRRLPRLLSQRLLPWAARRLPHTTGKIPLDFKARQFTGAAALPTADAHFGFKEFLTEEARRALYAGSIGHLEESRRLYHERVAGHRFGDPIDEVLYLDYGVYLPDDILTKTDRCSMAVSLETRVPLLDREVVELAASFPASWKLRGLSGKHVLKRSLRTVLDPDLLRRRKEGFNSPMAAWLRGPLRPLLLDLLSCKELGSLSYLRCDAVEQIRDEHLDGRRERSRPLWALLVLVLWARRHLHG